MGLLDLTGQRLGTQRPEGVAWPECHLSGELLQAEQVSDVLRTTGAKHAFDIDAQALRQELRYLSLGSGTLTTGGATHN